MPILHPPYTRPRSLHLGPKPLPRECSACFIREIFHRELWDHALRSAAHFFVMGLLTSGFNSRCTFGEMVGPRF